jgi:hypothetical protein
MMISPDAPQQRGGPEKAPSRPWRPESPRRRGGPSERAARDDLLAGLAGSSAPLALDGLEAGETRLQGGAGLEARPAGAIGVSLGHELDARKNRAAHRRRPGMGASFQAGRPPQAGPGGPPEEPPGQARQGAGASPPWRAFSVCPAWALTRAVKRPLQALQWEL